MQTSHFHSIMRLCMAVYLQLVQLSNLHMDKGKKIYHKGLACDFLIPSSRNKQKNNSPAAGEGLK